MTELESAPESESVPETVAMLMHPGTLSVNMDDSIAAVESVLASRGRSWAPVVDNTGTVIGVISAGDLLSFHAQQRDAQAVQAWQLCSYQPVVVGPQASLAEVAQQMLQRHAHHAVVAEGAQLLGYVSSLDFVARFARGPGPPAFRP
jgi:CBS-domain-containing membrane protein